MNKEELKFRDQFGNEVTLYKMTDGLYRKVTQTNKDMNFEFLGDTYSYYSLICSSTIKEYWDSYHSRRALVQDNYGRLFHYRYDEEMNFDGGPDREDYLWTLVTDEKDSDQLTDVGNLSLLREPYIAADENDWVAAHEYIDKKFVDKLNSSDKVSPKKMINFFKAIIHR